MNVGDHFEALTASLSKLIGLHIKLARLEAIEDVKGLGRRSAVVLALAPLALAAFVLLTGAAVVGLTRLLPLDAVLALVGGVYALVAAIGAGVVRQSLRALPSPLNDSAAEVNKTLAVVDSRGVLAHG